MTKNKGKNLTEIEEKLSQVKAKPSDAWHNFSHITKHKLVNFIIFY